MATPVADPPALASAAPRATTLWKAPVAIAPLTNPSGDIQKRPGGLSNPSALARRS
jgi:hypothetical protein